MGEEDATHVAVPVLHRPSRRARRCGARGTPPRVRGLHGLRAGEGTRAFPIPTNPRPSSAAGPCRMPSTATARHRLYRELLRIRREALVPRLAGAQIARAHRPSGRRCRGALAHGRRRDAVARQPISAREPARSSSLQGDLLFESRPGAATRHAAASSPAPPRSLSWSPRRERRRRSASSPARPASPRPGPMRWASPQQVSVESLRRILDALGLPTATSGDIDDEPPTARAADTLPPLVTMTAGSRLALPGRQAGLPGGSSSTRTAARHAALLDAGRPAGRPAHRPPGYHRLRLRRPRR